MWTSCRLLALAALIVLSNIAREARSQDFSLHDSCRYACKKCVAGPELYCDSTETLLMKHIPLHDINFTAIPHNVRSISLVNFVYPVEDALHLFPSPPERPNLTHVSLVGNEGQLFRSLHSFPFPRFLINNRQHIIFLRMSTLRLTILTRSHFAGFNQLEEVRLSDCMIRQIDEDVFENLGDVAVGSHAPSRLTELFLINNEINTLNWSMLRPISQSVMRIIFRKCEIEGLTTTVNETHFVLHQAYHIDLSYNQIKHVPPAVFSTLNTSLPFELVFEADNSSEQFCHKHKTCDCSDICEFGVWLKEHEADSGIIDLQCAGTKYNATNLDTMPVYSPCPVPTTPFPENLEPSISSSSPIQTSSGEFR